MMNPPADPAPPINPFVRVLVVESRDRLDQQRRNPLAYAWRHARWGLVLGALVSTLGAWLLLGALWFWWEKPGGLGWLLEGVLGAAVFLFVGWGMVCALPAVQAETEWIDNTVRAQKLQRVLEGDYQVEAAGEDTILVRAVATETVLNRPLPHNLAPAVRLSLGEARELTRRGVGLRTAEASETGA